LGAPPRALSAGKWRSKGSSRSPSQEMYQKSSAPERAGRLRALAKTGSSITPEQDPKGPKELNIGDESPRANEEICR